MYKLLIVDDEQVIREGLRDLIDWNALGFQTAGVFEDGREVIAYLEHGQADLIITDIRMPAVTGLDIARLVYENKIPSTIIFISGYSELELAMSAIKYNVRKYILKPIDLDDLVSAVLEARRQLDEAAQVRLDRIALDTVKQGIEEIKEDFFEELLVGSIKSNHYVRSMFHFLYPDYDAETCRFFLETLVIQDYAHYGLQHQTHSKNELYTCLKNCINLSSSVIEYRMVTKNEERIQLLGMIAATQAYDRRCAAEMIEAGNRDLCNNLQGLLEIDCTITELEIYDNITGILTRYPSSTPSGLDDSLKMKIDEQLKTIYAALCAGKDDTYDSLVDRLKTYFDHLARPEIQSIVSQWLTSVKERLNDTDKGVYPDPQYEIHIRRIRMQACAADVTTCLNQILTELSDLIGKSEQHEQTLIEQARKYIREHIAEDISLEDISEKFYLSQYYFSRIFKSQTGENFIDFVIHEKMEFAMSLLKNPQYRIYEICGLVGYKSNHHFGKMFKSYAGCSPSTYRKQIV